MGGEFLEKEFQKAGADAPFLMRIPGKPRLKRKLYKAGFKSLFYSYLIVNMF